MKKEGGEGGGCLRERFIKKKSSNIYRHFTHHLS